MSQKIHLIFKTHLDIGFTDFASSVIQKYFTEYIPSALHIAREMRRTDQSEKFIWTTGSWLIYEYLEQAPPAQRKEMETAILAGDITWHALPFTTHTELMDAELFRFGLSLSQELDQRFGKHTIAAKMTDVPGHTRGIIPLMVEADIKFLHIGVNPGSSIPCVPALFRWQDPSGKELIVMYESGYGNIFAVDGIEDALAFAHTIDNLGPQSSKQVLDIYHSLQKSFPNAKIFASSLNDFAIKLEPIRQRLPIITQEIGDTWIHGIGSDPLKVSQFRELLRLRHTWLIHNPAICDEKWFKAFQRRLLLVPEHTWGMDEKTFLRDHDNYEANKFNAARSQANFKKFESSWAEKRAYIQSAVEELGNSPFANSARKHLESICPSHTDLSGWNSVTDAGQPIELTHFTIRFNPSTCALVSLVSHNTSKEWASEYHPVGFLRYQTFSSEDYERFFHQYILPSEQKNSWSREDFTKPGMELADPPSRFWHLPVNDQYIKTSNGDTQYLFRLIAEPPSNQEYGCPQEFYLQYTFHQNVADIDIDLQWFNKPACRLPEALWFTFNPQLSQNAEWSIEKLGEKISPLDVVKNGNRHLHAAGESVTFMDTGEQIEIMALDSPLIAPGQPSLLNFTNDQPDITGGMHFNLLNNVWGTNFPMWFEDDCRFRFTLRFSKIEF
ncbi:MAG TPA: glycoside hydrolase [Anaerolineaceae bacterium]|nr:glycoside hydrolase [Anaerolineaceae bacterium]